MRNVPRIVIVDDDPLTLQLLGAVLRADGCEVIPEQEGSRALDCVLSQQPDLLVLAAEMRSADGLEIGRQLGLVEATWTLPILFVAGAEVDHDGLAAALDRGAHDFITKPLEAAVIRARVRACLRSKRLHEELTEKAHLLSIRSTIDDLTGLCNRRMLFDRLRAEIARSKRYRFGSACALVDVDDLRAVNDRFGNLAGDRVLQELAIILRSTTRLYDGLFRYASDEFAIVLPQSDAEQGYRAADRIRKRVENHVFASGDLQLQVTVSVGIATFPNDAEEPEQLLRRAEDALAAAKRSGRNRLAPPVRSGEI